MTEQEAQEWLLSQYKKEVELASGVIDRKERRKLYQKEYSRRKQAELKANPEAYAKYLEDRRKAYYENIEHNRNYAREKYRAKTKQEKAVLTKRHYEYEQRRKKEKPEAYAAEYRRKKERWKLKLQNLTDEEKAEYHNRRNARRLARRICETPEERAERLRKRREHDRAKLAAMSPEELEAYRVVVRARVKRSREARIHRKEQEKKYRVAI